MKKHLVYVATMISVLTFQSCTDNVRARLYGGTEEITIPTGRKFINMTWKGNQMWVLTEDSTYIYFDEHSSFGVVEGTVKIRK